MADPYDLTEAIRNAILAMEETHSRGKLAAMAGVSKSVMSDFLNKREKQPQIGTDKVTSLARSMKLPIVRLFGAVASSDAMPRPVTPVLSSSSSDRTPGDAHDGPEADSLQRQIADRDQTIRSLRVAISAHAEQLKEVSGALAKLAGTPRTNVRKAARGKPSAG